jgi:hypothetical protein
MVNLCSEGLVQGSFAIFAPTSEFRTGLDKTTLNPSI